MKLAYKLIDKLMENPTKMNIIAVDKVLKVGIPFNAPHGFKILSLGKDGVTVSLPNRKLNHNHLSGIHACAMATVGEYCAGLSLLSTFGISRYRLIMSEMNVKYVYQGRKDLEGFCDPKQIDEETLHRALKDSGLYVQTLTTTIREQKTGRDVASVTTTWQIKSWDQVKTKG